MNKSAISWTKLTWNPTHGCSRVSEGCRNCYAEQLSLKRGWTKKPWTARNADENVMMKPHKLREPAKVKEPSMIFVNSMSDLFHPNIPDDYRRQIWDVMLEHDRHTYQILTKRPEIAAKWDGPWPDHIWLGASVEDDRVFDRVCEISNTGAAVKWLSAEPLIGPIDLHGALNEIDWVVVGGESGQGFRKMPHAWARDVRDACAGADTQTAFFFKQSAAYRTELGTSMMEEDGTFWTWAQFPGNLVEPVKALPHRYVYEEARASTAA